VSILSNILLVPTAHGPTYTLHEVEARFRPFDVDDPGETVEFPFYSGYDTPVSSDTDSDMQSECSYQTTLQSNRVWNNLITRKVNQTNTNIGPYFPEFFYQHQPQLTPKMRCILLDWCIEVSNALRLTGSTYHRAVTLIDCVLASTSHTETSITGDQFSPSNFQLLGATCMWIAYKLLEAPHKKTNHPHDFCFLCDDTYCLEDFLQMEIRVYRSVQFRLLSHPTPHDFLPLFLATACRDSFYLCQYTQQPDYVITGLAYYLLYLGRFITSDCAQKPSLLAAAVVFLCRATLRIQSTDHTLCQYGLWTLPLLQCTGYTKADLKQTVLALWSLQATAGESQLFCSAFRIFNTDRYAQASVRRCPDFGNFGFRTDSPKLQQLHRPQDS
jgi:hypothetical protein